MTRADRLAQLVEKQRELRKHIADAEAMSKAVDGARIQLENGLNDAAYATQEISGQVTLVKDRQKWVIGRQHELEVDIRKLQKELGMKSGESK
jgi:ribosomal protein L18